MKILIVNDDSIDAPGIQVLARAASELGEVWIAAPDQQCSALSQKLTLRELISLEDPRYSPYVAENLVILEDNSIEYNLGEASEYLVVTESIPNALNLSTLPLFAQAGFSGEVYLGIIANTPRLSECEAYFAFLIE